MAIAGNVSSARAHDNRSAYWTLYRDARSMLALIADRRALGVTEYLIRADVRAMASDLHHAVTACGFHHCGHAEVRKAAFMFVRLYQVLMRASTARAVVRAALRASGICARCASAIEPGP